MATTPAVLRIEADEISLPDLATAITEFSAVLVELDRDLSSGRDHSLRWRVTELTLGSAVIAAEAEPEEDALDIGPTVVGLLVAGVGLIERRAERPPEVSDESLDHLRKLASLVNNGTQLIRVEAPTLQVQEIITKRTVANIDIVIGQGYTSIGAVEGTIEAISIHGRPYFVVYDAVTGRAVHCDFDPALRHRVIDALGQKVMARGRVRRDISGRPTYVRALEEFVLLGQPPHESALDLAGLYRGMSQNTLDYLAEIRGE